MKKHKIDQLFAGKLKNHKTPPADKVWETLEEELGETSHRSVGIWWRVAAVVLLCLSAGLWVYHGIDNNKKLMVQQEVPKVNTDEQPAQNETEILEENRDDLPLLSTSPDKRESPQVAAQQAPSSPEKMQEKQPEQQDVTATQPKPSEVQTFETWVAEQPVHTVESIEPVTNITVEQEEETMLENNDLPDKVTAVAVEVREPVTIIYKANTKTKADEAETEKDNKFFEVVKDIKNGDLGLAELRDAKSDLIAAAFSKLKDKRDKQ